MSAGPPAADAAGRRSQREPVTTDGIAFCLGAPTLTLIAALALDLSGAGADLTVWPRPVWGRQEGRLAVPIVVFMALASVLACGLTHWVARRAPRAWTWVRAVLTAVLTSLMVGGFMSLTPGPNTPERAAIGPISLQTTLLVATLGCAGAAWLSLHGRGGPTRWIWLGGGLVVVLAAATFLGVPRG